MKLSTISISILASLTPSLVQADVVSLTPENYHTLTAGKAVFIKFFAPWCGHCKAMAADYEKLATTHASSTDKLIAEVDCTNETSKQLCQDNGVSGFPTLKYGNPTSLEDYQGGRDFKSLNEFVTTELKLGCSPLNIELCNENDKKAIEQISAMDDAALTKEIERVEGIMKDADDELQKGIEGLQAKFESMLEAHENKIDEMKEEFKYKLKRSVLAFKKKEAGIVDEENDDDEEEEYDDDDDEF